MGRVSKRKIDPEIEERVFEIFRNYLASVYNPKDVQIFLSNLLSYTEQVMLAKRLAIAVLLTKGYTYEQIDETIKVSKSTVGTVHKQLLIGAEGYIKAVNKILSDEKHELLWNKLETLMLELSLPKRYGSPAWERKSKLGKHLIKRRRKLSSI